MSLTDYLFGRRLATYEEGEQRVGVLAGIPMLGLDALGSAAYGPEAALTLLIPLGAAGVAYIGPISTLIIVLLLVVYFSYRQTIAAYPHGGGSYTVAKENLGTTAGLLAAAALMLDYVLVVAVGISAGVGALVSALPALQPHTLALCLATLAPDHDRQPPRRARVGPGVHGPDLPLRRLAAGGAGHRRRQDVLPAAIRRRSWRRRSRFRRPPAAEPLDPDAGVRQRLHGDDGRRGGQQRRQRLPRAGGPARPPHPDGDHRAPGRHAGRDRLPVPGLRDRRDRAGPGRLSERPVAARRRGRRQGRVLLRHDRLGAGVLALSANTGFADFPRLCRVIAQDGFLPNGFAHRGRRLVYSQGILVLAVLSAGLLIVFGGITDRLIPLFAVGAFLAFTLSQAGMVAHWRRVGGEHARKSMAINGAGAVCTAVTLAVVLVSKFAEGAWVMVLLIPALLVLFHSVHAHYQAVGREVATSEPLDAADLEPPLVLLPIRGWSAITRKAMRLALKISPDVYALHIAGDEQAMLDLEDGWETLVRAAGAGRRTCPPRS